VFLGADATAAVVCTGAFLSAFATVTDIFAPFFFFEVTVLLLVPAGEEIVTAEGAEDLALLGVFLSLLDAGAGSAKTEGGDWGGATGMGAVPAPLRRSDLRASKAAPRSSWECCCCETTSNDEDEAGSADLLGST
jgi:hypothetical protein